MPRGRSRKSGEAELFWPGYVDVLSTLLLVVTFLLSIFMLSQYFVSQESSGKDNALKKLNRQLAELTNILSLEKGKTKTAEDELSSLAATLSALRDDNAKLGAVAAGTDTKLKGVEAKVTALTTALDSEKNLSTEAQSKLDILNQQLLALRKQIGALNEALGASEAKDKDNQERIADMGQRLNAALARQVQELQRYRSDFFGRLRESLKDRKDIRVVGDRFVFQSEVLFPSGQANMTKEGLVAIDQLAQAIVALEGTIPPEINWSLQVDGHTDTRPIASREFPSNWELSTARAIQVVRYLVSRGVPAKRLVAAGYGEYQPLEAGETEELLRRNRRIELKLTNR
jgi:chemotaxis protein MotB